MTFRLVTVALLFFSSSSFAQKISNLPEIRRALGLQRLIDDISVNRPVKVAILDKAFYKVEKEIGVSLPKTTVYVPGEVAVPEDLKSDHGVRMAQLVAGLVDEKPGRSKRLDLRLYNAYGFTNFKSAVADVIKRETDIVLYSEVWEYGGNLDGGGFINAEVDRAIGAGVLWINAAGNFGRTTYNGAIEAGDEDWVRLPDLNNALKIVCRAEKGKTCPTKVVLSWNDFKDDAEEGTDKDLDFALTDDLLNVIRSSALQQSADRNENRPGYSKYPREIVAAELKPGTYYIRVKKRSDNFESDDRLRITVDGDLIEMPSAQPQDSLLVPADNLDALTVGAIDSDRSGVSSRLRKPELFAISSVRLSNGDEFRGSSNSAAFAAAAAVLLKLTGEELSKGLLLQRSRQFNWEKGGPSLNMLRFAPANQGCFQDGTWNDAPEYISEVLSAGGRLALTNIGWRLMVPFDPATLAGLRRNQPDDMITISANGWQVYPRLAMIPPGTVEVFQRPLEAGLCNRVQPSQGYILGF